MPASDLLPLAGKYGVFTYTGVNLPMEEWSITGPQGDYLDCAHFLSEGGDYGLVGIVGGEITFKGKFNAKAGGNQYQAPLSIKPEATPTIFCGFNAVLGFTLTVLVLGGGNSTGVRKAGEVEFRARIQGKIRWPGDP